MTHEDLEWILKKDTLKERGYRETDDGLMITYLPCDLIIEYKDTGVNEWYRFNRYYTPEHETTAITYEELWNEK